MAKIGFVGQYGWARGICNVYNMMAKTLKNEHEIFMLQRGNNECSEEFEKINIQKHEQFDISSKTFEKWLMDNKIELVIFNEEQWIGKGQTDCLVDSCIKLNIKTFHYVVWEQLNLKDFEYYEKFDKIICPTTSCYDLMKNFGFENIEYVRWGADTDIFKPIENYEKKIKDKTVFLHVGGYGGMFNRKQTEEVIEAFTKLKNNDKSILIVTRQDIQTFGGKPGNYKHPDYENVEFYVGTVSQNDLIKFYQEADVILLPSKWEGNGLPFHEALAMGRPVITVNAPPMNEVIKDGINGLCADVLEQVEYEGIYTRANIVNVNSLKNKMTVAMSPVLLELMKTNAIKTSKEIWDWKENSKKLLKLIEELK